MPKQGVLLGLGFFSRTQKQAKGSGNKVQLGSSTGAQVKNSLSLLGHHSQHDSHVQHRDHGNLNNTSTLAGRRCFLIWWPDVDYQQVRLPAAPAVANSLLHAPVQEEKNRTTTAHDLEPWTTTGSFVKTWLRSGFNHPI